VNKPVIFFDLDETLIHYDDDRRVLVRPGAQAALEKLAKVGDLQVFTAAHPLYAKMVLRESALAPYFSQVFSVMDFAWYGRSAGLCVIVDDGATLDMKIPYLGKDYKVVFVEPFMGQDSVAPLTRYVAEIKAAISSR